jgi:uncharacterized membrane protein YeaQ/YmgE (transglycosylase-associated protein family)
MKNTSADSRSGETKMLDNLGSMDFGQIVVLLLIAVVVGWLAGVITRGGGFGLLGDILVAFVGAFAGRYLFDLLGINIGGGGYLDLFITATVGAVIILLIVRLIRRV